jgi:hypothetical protein
VAPAGGGGVLELLVAVVAVVLAQRHLLRRSSFLRCSDASPLSCCSRGCLEIYPSSGATSGTFTTRNFTKKLARG